MGVYEEWSRLTPAEQLFIATHPQHALTIKNSKSTAYSETQRVMGHNRRNDPSDAFRHCFWSAILSRDMGYVDALAFTNAHESDPSNPPREKAMDLHNNGVGLSIGGGMGGTISRIVLGEIATDIGNSLFGPSNADLSNQCQAALRNGQLQTSP